MTWETLMGADAGHFAFDNGALSFKEDPDYEARPDNTYEVTVRARDEGGNIGELRVTVTAQQLSMSCPPSPATPRPASRRGARSSSMGTYQAIGP